MKLKKKKQKRKKNTFNICYLLREFGIKCLQKCINGKESCLKIGNVTNKIITILV